MIFVALLKLINNKKKNYKIHKKNHFIDNAQKKYIFIKAGTFYSKLLF